MSFLKSKNHGYNYGQRSVFTTKIYKTGVNLIKKNKKLKPTFKYTRISDKNSQIDGQLFT